MICRALLVYCVKHYKGDEKIKSFIWDLITPTKDGQNQALQNHSGIACSLCHCTCTHCRCASLWYHGSGVRAELTATGSESRADCNRQRLGVLEHRDCLHRESGCRGTDPHTAPQSRQGWLGGEAVSWLPVPWLVQKEPCGGHRNAIWLSHGHC